MGRTDNNKYVDFYKKIIHRQRRLRQIVDKIFIMIWSFLMQRGILIYFKRIKRSLKLNSLSHFIIPNFATTREKKEIIEEIFSTHIY